MTALQRKKQLWTMVTVGKAIAFKVYNKFEKYNLQNFDN